MYDDMIAFEFDPFKNEPDYGMEVMQFTGLYDKNGKKIYEGDIIPVNEGLHNMVVVYSVKDAAYLLLGRENGFYYMLGDIYNVNPRLLEVIGNFYENADLLDMN